MFTGLVEAKSHLHSTRLLPGEAKNLIIHHNFNGLQLGESIAVNGACLTVVAFDEEQFEVEVSNETLRMTTLDALPAGAPLNLERALVLGARLGGHMVSGHVDGIGEISALNAVGDMNEVDLLIPQELLKFIATKGSLTIDGVSLTVNSISENHATLLLIPHTRKVTTLGNLQVGQMVNIEVDLIARHVERLLQQPTEASRRP